MALKDMTKEEIDAAIAKISAQMKGPMPDIQRSLLHAYRKDFRAELARREAVQAQ